MTKILRCLLLHVLLMTTLSMQSGCENLSDVLQQFSSEQQSAEEIVDGSTSGIQRDILMDIIESQSMLVEEMYSAKSIGDYTAIKESYEDVLRLEQRYQQEFERLETGLSAADALDISKKHRKLIRNLPEFSSLMR